MFIFELVLITLVVVGVIGLICAHYGVGIRNGCNCPEHYKYYIGSSRRSTERYCVRCERRV